MAEREAMRRCNTEDAKALCWAKGGWYCALADGSKSYGAAMAATAEEAKAKALKFRRRGGSRRADRPVLWGRSDQSGAQRLRGEFSGQSGPLGHGSGDHFFVDIQAQVEIRSAYAVFCC